MGEDYPKNVTINRDPKSSYWFVSFVTADGRKRRSTKVPVAGGLYKKEFLTKSQAKNRAFIEGMRIAEDECKLAEGFNRVSVRDFLNGYLERRRPYITHATYVNMRGAYKAFNEFLGKRADRPLYEVTRGDAKAFVEMRRKEIRMHSVRKNVTNLCPAFNDAVDSDIIVKNPFVRIKIEPDRDDEKLAHDAFTLDEIKFMVVNFPGEWPSAVRCCYETYGQRIGDIVFLKWKQFDFKRKVVTITTEKTGAFLEQPMRTSFYQWAKMEFETRGSAPEDFVHPYLAGLGSRKASLEFGQLVRLFKIGFVSEKAAGKRRQYNSKTFHCIRATAATLIQTSGASSGMAMKLVGHESEAIHRGYLRPDIEQLRQVAEGLPGIV